MGERRRADRIWIASPPQPTRATLTFTLFMPVTPMLQRFGRDATGGPMAEYALVVGVIALVALVGAKALGASIARQAVLMQYIWPF